MSFNKHDIRRDACQLFGRQARQGYDWWWHSFTAVNDRTNEEKAFLRHSFCAIQRTAERNRCWDSCRQTGCGSFLPAQSEDGCVFIAAHAARDAHGLFTLSEGVTGHTEVIAAEGFDFKLENLLGICSVIYFVLTVFASDDILYKKYTYKEITV